MVPTTVVRIVIMSWMIFLIIDQLSFIFIYSFFLTSLQVNKLTSCLLKISADLFH